MQGFGYDTIDRLFESAAQLGLTVGRTWAMNYGMPQEPGGRRQHRARELGQHDLGRE